MANTFKGSLDKYSNNPTRLFSKDSSDFYTIRSVGNGNNCMLIIIVQFNLLSKKYVDFQKHTIQATAGTIVWSLVDENFCENCFYFHIEMISPQFLWDNVLLGGKKQLDTKRFKPIN